MNIMLNINNPKYNTFETTFENSGIKHSKMFSVVVDIVEGLKYNSKEEVEIAIDNLSKAKEEEIKRVKEIIEIKDMVCLNKKDFNRIIHNFLRETKVVDNIIKLLKKIDFDYKEFGKYILKFISISSLIVEEYSKNMFPEECKCFFGHSSFKIV